MKKLLQKILCLGLIMGVSIQPMTTFASSTKNTEEASVNIKPVLTDKQSGKALDKAIKSVKETSSKKSSDGAITKSYEVVVTLQVDTTKTTVDTDGLITPMDATGGTITEADCKATLDITYYLRNYNTEIKITNISGGWQPQSAYIVVNNRVASVTDGGVPPFNKTLRNTPSSNSFYYNTGWDYSTFYPGSDYTGARGYTEADLSIPGMGGSYDLFLKVSIDR